MSLRFVTAGESHGPGLTAIVEGLPAGLELRPEDIDRDLARRQLGHGRGGRMKIEKDRARVTAGIRHGRTLGSPVAMWIENRDYQNWEERMNPWPVEAEVDEVHLPRPGHADLAGIQKYGHTDVRNVLERASARETAARVAAGALAKAYIRELGVEVRSHVTRIGTVTAPARERLSATDFEGVDDSPVRSLDAAASEAMVAEIDAARKANESLGGEFEVMAFGLVPGIGSHVSWEERLDGRLAQAIMSIQALKGVGIGDGFALAERVGSRAHDEIFWSDERGYNRETNRAGGIEGGMTTGDPVVVVGAMKPLPTLTKPLRSVDTETKEPAQALRQPPEWWGRRWWRWCSPPPTARSSAATTSTTRRPVCGHTTSASAGGAHSPRARRLHGGREVHRRPLARRGARRRAARFRPRARAAARRARRVLLRQGGRAGVSRT
jgi:chorismate synthase